MTFNALHQTGTPLLLANVWDVNSALAAEKAGYQALGTSSAAIAKSEGYPDGENLPFSSLLRIVERIQTATQLPLSVDVENGYGSTPDAITANIEALVHLGVAGVNIEDSRVENGRRILLDPEDFARTLATVIATIHRNHPAFFFNVRTDTFLLDHPDACTETLRRAERYAAAGANGLFVPGVTTSEDILTITKATDLPLNVMCWLGLPPHKELAQMGVARISSGNFAYEQVLLRQDSLFADLFAARDFSAIL